MFRFLVWFIPWLMCLITANVLGQSPVCVQPGSPWNETTQTDTGDPPYPSNGFPQGSSVVNCQTVCRVTDRKTFSAVRRNGHEARRTKCYCADSLSATASRCDFRCGGLQCGGERESDQKYSVYPVCTVGSYGTDCQSSCSQFCANPVCNVVSGACDGCEGHRRYGTMCETECPQNCQGNKCAQVDGACDGPCVGGYHGAKCDMECSINCAQTMCGQNDAACDGGCKAGWFGLTCDQQCPVNCDGTCGLTNGTCSKCLPGFYGEKCDMTCSANCNQTVCDFGSGACTFRCNPGFFGDRCTEACPSNCETNTCYFSNGTCTDGCKPGFYEPACNTPCPGRCANNNCDFTDGTCDGPCENRYFGSEFCDDMCPPNCLGGACNKSDGACVGGCVAGFDGDICDSDIDECSTPGANDCSERGENLMCHNTIGSFLCCESGVEESDSGIECAGGRGLSMPAVIGISVVAAIVVIAGIIIAVLVVRHRRRPKTVERDRPFNTHKEHEKIELGVTAVDNTQNGREPPKVISHEEQEDLPVEYTKGNTPSTDEVDKSSAPVSSLPPAAPAVVTSSKDFKLKDFPGYVAQKLNVKNYFEKELKSLPTKYTREYDEATDEDLKKKNRFKGIYPYNDNRVRLEPIPGEPLSSYINASWVQGYEANDQFIATLGPRSRTVDDFWRMIWQENIATIVMVTNLKEVGVEKCVQYWPTEKSEIFNDITVTIMKTRQRPESTERTLEVRKAKDVRSVTQHHFTVWPDHGVPSNTTCLINFRRKTIMKATPGVPVVIHCSAGVGRTGTLIALDYLIKQADTEGKLNVYACVERLRDQRNYMVQSTEQYTFLHQALSEYIRVGDTTIKSSEFSNRYEELTHASNNSGPLAKQFKMLQDSSPRLSDFDKESALSDENKDKNRYQDIIPLCAYRIYLKRRVKGRTDYINAVRVNSFLQKDKYIVTQIPLPDTVVDFWRLLADESSCQTIVLFTTKSQAKELSHFMPTEDQPTFFTNKAAVVRSAKSFKVFASFEIGVGECDESNLYSNLEGLQNLINEQSYRVFEVTLADNVALLDPDLIIKLHNTLNDHLSETKGNKKVLVTCLNGALYSGQFVACCNMFEMIDSEQEVDVYQVTKYIRESRPHFINDMKQYRGLHTVAKKYLSNFDIYVNA